jgi:hypothetical protein
MTWMKYEKWNRNKQMQGQLEKMYFEKQTNTKENQ